MELGAARSFFSQDPAPLHAGAGLVCALPDKQGGLAQPVLSLLDKELQVPVCGDDAHRRIRNRTDRPADMQIC